MGIALPARNIPPRATARTLTALLHARIVITTMSASPSDHNRPTAGAIHRRVPLIAVILLVDAVGLVLVSLHAVGDFSAVLGTLTGLPLFFVPKYLLVGVTSLRARTGAAQYRVDGAYRAFFAADVVVLTAMWSVSIDDPLAFGALAIEVVWGVVGPISALIGLIMHSRGGGAGAA